MIITLEGITEEYRIHRDELQYTLQKRIRNLKEGGYRWNSVSFHHKLYRALENLAVRVSATQEEKVSLQEYITLYKANLDTIKEVIGDI